MMEPMLQNPVSNASYSKYLNPIKERFSNMKQKTTNKGLIIAAVLILLLLIVVVVVIVVVRRSKKNSDSEEPYVNKFTPNSQMDIDNVLKKTTFPVENTEYNSADFYKSQGFLDRRDVTKLDHDPLAQIQLFQNADNTFSYRYKKLY